MDWRKRVRTWRCSPRSTLSSPHYSSSSTAPVSPSSSSFSLSFPFPVSRPHPHPQRFHHHRRSDAPLAVRRFPGRRRLVDGVVVAAVGLPSSTSSTSSTSVSLPVSLSVSLSLSSSRCSSSVETHECDSTTTRSHPAAIPIPHAPPRDAITPKCLFHLV